jgi:acyl-CoA thioester hydrolase
MSVVANSAGYVHTARVHFDELDAMHMLHNARFFIHMERTASEFFRDLGRRWERNVADNPDQFSVVRAQRIDYLVPFLGTGELRVEMWIAKLGRTSCTLGFEFTSADASIVYARGERTIVKLNPQTLRPAPWTDRFRDAVSVLLRLEGDRDGGQ